MSDSQNWITFWTALAALAAAASAALAVVLTGLTWQTVRDASAPRLVVYAKTDSNSPTIIQIVIANIGNGVATDVVFHPSKPIPFRAYGLDLASAEPPEVMPNGPLVDGIPLLAPGERRVITWGQYGGLLTAIGDGYISVTAVYNHDNRSMKSYSRLEVRSFEGTDANEATAYRATRELEKIAEHAKQISSAARSIASDVAVLTKTEVGARDLTRVAADTATGGQ